jgi:hypothetical protein
MIACACATGNHVTGPDRKSRNRNGPNRKWSRAHAQPVHVVLLQHVSLRMTDSATGSDMTSKGVPLGMRMRNRKLRYICPSGEFWPEVTLWNITRSDPRLPEGVPLCMCMRNRKLRNILPSRVFSLEVRSSPIGLLLEVGRCSLGRPRLSFSRPGYLPLLFSYNI